MIIKNYPFFAKIALDPVFSIIVIVEINLLAIMAILSLSMSLCTVCAKHHITIILAFDSCEFRIPA